MNIELKIEDDDIKLYLPNTHSIDFIKSLVKKIRENDVQVILTDRLSIDQNRLIWVLCHEYGELLGYTREEMRGILENEFCNEREIEYFSISPHKENACSMEIATEFIQFIIEHSIKMGVNLIIHEGKGPLMKRKQARDVVPDIRRFVLACLLNKTCAVCGRKNVELHHWDPIGSFGYEHDDGLQTRFISLCGEHHSEFHLIGAEEFERRYHLQGIWLSVNLVIALKKVYPWHFKGFKKEKYIKSLEVKNDERRNHKLKKDNL
ncbi:hypothetical protein FSBG_00158 [Fusobacterium gonidiaformans 3-1-5R]|uniref:Uncharacterized protein n=1 Tax=Fusobacterium gonidiaformans 3-1-5R TaxID=469605 RepID=E5BEY0_9FUSO|nr:MULTISPECIES: putative HNHc nuclease [Fusobacterium]EFS20661.1 hypothetical protein FSBG_00158 [Fusobacterium gonidiaformans 3-1-5R]KYM58544.1 hypothetical protein A2U09_07760 [Fusobacterium necrophorum subsp. funduliforme]